MTDIEKQRQLIDETDEQLLELLTKRMECSKQIALIKKEKGLPVYDSRRERSVISGISSKADPQLVTYMQSVWEMIFSVSRSYQSRFITDGSKLRSLIDDAKKNTDETFPSYAVVACQGIEGANSQLACDRVFRDPGIMYFSRFEGVFQAVSSGMCRYGILPIENSTAGSVNEVYDLMRKNKFYIVRSVKYKIEHCLMAKPGTKLSDITEIRSHEQAISQCSEYLMTLSDDIAVTAVENTAVAARQVSESNETGTAAICSRECAELYGLNVLKDNIGNSDSNFTRFIVISKKLEIYPGSDKISLMMQLPHRPGSLAQVISKFSALGLNLTKLESRPIAGKDFEFMFYFDVRADVAGEDVETLLCEFDEQIDGFTYLGSYTEIS